MLVYKSTNEFPIRVGEVQFGLLSPDEIERMSTVEVNDTTIYYRGLPNPYGINDHRMGTVDRRLLCGSCCRDVKLCQGHVGHMKLAYPMYHIGFFDVTFKTLRALCFACSRLCMTDDELEALPKDMSSKTRFATVTSQVKNKKRCCHCGMQRPQYVRNPLCIRIEWPADMEWESDAEREHCTEIFTARECLSIFTHMTDADVRHLGLDPHFCHPKNTIVTTLLVPPPVARPAIMASEGSRSRGQDDLTHKLQDINKRSQELQAAMSDDATWRGVKVTAELHERILKLQFEVFTYVNNSIRGQKQSTQRSGAPTKSITDRLKGKDGRIRGNLMGKRVDFSARSVITPDAVMDVDEVGIPHKIAMSLTIPERVTMHNIRSLTDRVVNGPTHLHGAETIITTSGITIQLALCQERDKIRLQYGWVVERFLTDGDIVIFNRQPSLHKMGMMGHRVKLMQGLTFRLNLCCANPYNADFDGDEMNLHVPQSTAARADVASLMMVSRQIISPQANRPVMGIVQDALLGAFLFSAPGIFLTREEACNLLARLRYRSTSGLPPPAVIAPVERWSSLQILSELFPPDMTYGNATVKEDQALSDFDEVVVRNGRMFCGRLNKKVLGTAAGGMVDVLFRDYGSSTTVRWMSELQRLVNAWLLGRGFSVGIKDCMLTIKGEERVRERIDTALQHATDLLRQPLDETTDERDVMEGTIVRILSKTLMQAGSIVEDELETDNAIRSMVHAGSKGNPINLSQICGCVGQQSIEGHRVFAEKGARTLPCFALTDNSLAGQGFVTNSYALGLQPHEFFFHAMGGREGLVDTAVKTATTGYIQRRQMKSMEDHRVCGDGTVRNAEECIIDFSYGGDDFDAARLERVRLKALEEDEATLRAALLVEWEATEAIRCRERLLRCKCNPFVNELDARVLLPFHPQRLRQRFLARSEVAIDRALAERLVREAVEAQPLSAVRLAILTHFGSRELVRRGTPEPRVRELLETIRRKVLSAQVNRGEMVGSIAAQSIGEPCTQMTLNTFHYAGVMSKNVTLGIPRLKELLDQSRNIKTPCNTIRFLPPMNKSQAFASYFADTLPLTRLGDIVVMCEMIDDPDVAQTVVAADALMLDIDRALNADPEPDASRFVARLHLNKNVMRSRRLTPPTVRRLLRARLKDRAHVIASETNAIEWVVRVRFLKLKTMLADLHPQWGEREALLCHRAITTLLDTVAVCGHPGISGAQMREVNYHGVNEYVVDTQGCNLLDLSAAPAIDWNNTTTNDIQEVHAIFGLEAAATTLYHELTTTISFDGTYVDQRHIAMIVNTMTCRGFVMPLSRHGINRMETGPLLRCSFEETPDILCDAACFAERDNGKGVSQNIMTGKLAPIGSGAMQVKLPSNRLSTRFSDSQTHRPRILKSTVRSKPSESTQDAPETISLFSSDTPVSSAASIFAPFQMQLPYDDAAPAPEEKKGNVFPRKRKYVPSSPKR